MRSCRRRRPRGVAAETVSVGDREHQRPIRHERRHVPAHRAPRCPRPFRARRPDDARVRGHRSQPRQRETSRFAIRRVLLLRARVALALARRRRRNPSSHGARQSVTRPAHERRSRARGSRAKVATSVWTLGSPSKVSRWVCRGRSGGGQPPSRGVGTSAPATHDSLHRAPGSTHRARRAPRRHPPLKRRDGSVSRDAPHYGRPRPRGRGAHVA